MSVQYQTPQKEYFVAKTPHTIPRARVLPTRPGGRGPGARACRRAAAGEPSRLLLRRTPHLDSSFLPTSAVLGSVSPSVPPESAPSGARSGTAQKASRPWPAQAALRCGLPPCTQPVRPGSASASAGCWMRPRGPAWDAGTYLCLCVLSEPSAFRSSSSFNVLRASASSQASLADSEQSHTNLPRPAGRHPHTRVRVGVPVLGSAGDTTSPSGVPHMRLRADALPVSVDSHQNRP